MKTMILAGMCIVVMMVGCGQTRDHTAMVTYDQSKDQQEIGVVYNSAHVIWTGSASQSPWFNDVYQKVEACLNKTTAEPSIIVIDGPIYSEGKLCQGVCSWSKGTIYINTAAYPVSHEYVHWITGEGNEIHGTPTQSAKYWYCDNIGSDQPLGF